MATPDEANDVYATLLEVNAWAMRAGLYEVAYHALAAARCTWAPCTLDGLSASALAARFKSEAERDEEGAELPHARVAGARAHPHPPERARPAPKAPVKAAKAPPSKGKTPPSKGRGQ